ncbi:MAG TPA: hypothetical protein VMY42_28885, partial [Thermoguttaceae bacterium]|nr:hypothetical protein [Thermoguttaceae bacterium]
MDSGLSVVSYQLSVISYQLSLDFCNLSNGIGKIGNFVSNLCDFGWRTTTREGRTMPAIVEFPKVVQ